MANGGKLLLVRCQDRRQQVLPPALRSRILNNALVLVHFDILLLI